MDPAQQCAHREAKQAKEIWFNQRRRWGIEQKFRFIKKEGLHIEDFRVLPLEGIRRLANVVLVAALFILNGRHVFPTRLSASCYACPAKWG